MERADGVLLPAAHRVLKRLGHRGLPAPAAAPQRLDGARRPCECGIGRDRFTVGAKSAAKADQRARVLREEAERLPEPLHGRTGIARREVREPGAIVRVHRELRPIELSHPGTISRSNSSSASVGVASCQPDDAEQPVQAPRRIALLHVCLAILDDGAFAKRGLGAVEHPARDMHHRRLEVRERKIRIQLHRPAHRLEALVAPGRVRQAELVAPVARLERHGAARGGQRLVERPALTRMKASVACASARSRSSSIARRT